MNFEKLYEKVKNGRYNANYKLIVICHLIQTPKLRDNKKVISKVLQNKNKSQNREIGHFMNCPVWRVLTDLEIISKIGDEYKLNAKLSNSEKKKIVQLCKELLK